MEEQKMQSEERFIIDSDSKAEWALKKIKAAQDEHSRLQALIDAEWQETNDRLNEKQREIDKDLENDTAYLKALLYEYMGTVNVKATKTQETYQLLTGKLVKKYGGIDYKRDDDMLLAWARANRPDCIKTKETLDWATIKKDLIVAGEDVMTSDGEILECIKAEVKPDSFDIKF